MSAEVIQLDEARQSMSDEPKLNDGYCRVVNALAEGLASHPISSVQQRVLWAVIRLTYGWQKTRDRIAAEQIAQITGMRRQHCSTALNELIEARVVIREGGSRSPIKINTKTAEWVFKKKATEGGNKRRVNGNSEKGSVNGNSVRSTNGNSVHTKDKRQDYRNTAYSSSSPSDDQSDQPARKSNRKPACPYEAIRDLYHEILPGNPECVVLSDKRRSHIRQRWNSKVKSTNCNDLDFWRRYFEFVSQSKFLTGQAQPTADRKVFRATLDWLVKAENFAKVIECKYHDDDELSGGEA